MCESPRAPFVPSASPRRGLVANCDISPKPQGLPASPHFITATPPPTPASSNTDTRTPAVRPRVTLIVPCYGLFYYSLPYPYRVQRPSTSTNSPNVKILQLSWHFRCMLRVANAYRMHTRSLQHPDCAETATNVASKTSCKLAVCTVPRPEQPLTAGAGRLPGVSTVALN